MDVVVAGGHGKIALLLERILADRGDEVRALIRNPDHGADVQAAGATPLVADLEALDADALAAEIGPADAIVFAAGAGPGSGPQRKWSMDHDGAIKLISAARSNGIARYVMVSASGADPRSPDDGGFGTYMRAKGQADAELSDSGLRFTIVRPVSLTDDPATHAVSTAEEGERQISRADVAATIAEVLHDPGTIGRNFVLRAGSTAIPDALAALA
ncbi:MAG: SDR family oxidoreductase [Solirubrobacterales bacterium]|nr:SDR family oxidoreductase [Solirubrobacterales bacterium]